MTTRCWLFMAIVGLASAALEPVPHQTNEESLRGALNAVTRKQRSLGSNAYYDRDEEDDDDELAFIPAGEWEKAFYRFEATMILFIGGGGFLDGRVTTLLPNAWVEQK